MPEGVSTIDRLKEEARARWDKLTDEDLDSIRNDLSSLATRLQARYGMSADEARRQAEEVASAVRENAADAYGRAAAAFEKAAQQADRIVRDNTWATIGAALLVGVVIGYLTGSERRRYW
jgi:ElaB/YqjD/DUF883 family membrane-anchored ribosome-binding protein